MTHYYVVLDTDDDDNLVVKPTQKTLALELFAEKGAFPMWDINAGDHQVTVYGGALESLPVGENKEEIDNLVLIVLGLKNHRAGLELQMVIIPKSDVKEFEDAIGINVVIPTSGIAICGIFVWGNQQADLKIYETSLLRINARLYIEVLQIAVEIADRLAKKQERTIPAIRTALIEMAQTFDRANLKVN